MRRLLQVLCVLALIGAGTLGGAYFWLKQRIAAPGPSISETVILVRPGIGVAEIAALLGRAGVVDDPRLIQVAVRLDESRGRGLRAGEFALPAQVSVMGALDILRAGKTVQRRLTVAEGLTSEDVLKLIDGAEGLKGTLPASVEEGRLLPETYNYAYFDKKTDVMRRMRRAMDDFLTRAWAGRAEGLPLETPEEALILASIVEKETGVAAERARIASVFINRLNRGMRLQSDPTAVFGVTGGKGLQGRPITKSDLRDRNPYNTYVIDRLPPAPIANPGKASIEAALNPARTDYLFFVADGTGGHAFARTLKEHNRNVAKWRRIERARKRTPSR